MDIRKANSRAWDWEADNGSAWARIESEETIEAARNGRPRIHITVERDVPEEWILPLKGRDVLCMGGGGGQQTPVLAAFGCHVTTLDLSQRMISIDREALDRYGLDAELVCGDMSSMPFAPASFDAVISPVSMNFIDDIEAVYAGVHRILRMDGSFIFGIANPALYMFDDRLLAKGRMKVKYTLPFSDTKSLSEKELIKRVERNDTVEYSHTLDTILGKLTEMGFAITGFFTDTSGFEPIDSFLQDCYLAVRCVKYR